MQTLAEIHENYKDRTDKGRVHSYIPLYEELLVGYREAALNVLEIGVGAGGSIDMWREYFEPAQIWAMDIRNLRDRVSPSVHFCHADSTSAAQVDLALGTTKFDVVIDDGSHDEHAQVMTWCNLWSRVAPGGLYVIEDVRDLNIAPYLHPAGRVSIIDMRGISKLQDDVLIMMRKRG